MQKEVLIHVRGLQMMDAQGDQEPIEIIVPGQYYFRNGSHYLRYEELLDETAEPTINYIKVSGKGLVCRFRCLSRHRLRLCTRNGSCRVVEEGRG